MAGDNYKGGFRDLEVWKEARQFRMDVSILVKRFPDHEKYRLTNQLIRASRSITANLAEGYGRFHFQENIQYCRQSRGSLMECLDHISCAMDEEFIRQEDFSKFEIRYDKILKMLNGYIKYLKNQKENA